MTSPIIAVLHGGVSSEREVSLGSGRACAQALARSYPTQLFDVTATALPPGLDPVRHVVFSTLHGTFGEDGRMQRLLEAAGIEYAGCDPLASALTIDKTRTKQTVTAVGLKGPRGLVFDAARPPAAAEIISRVGSDVVLKPNAPATEQGIIDHCRPHLAAYKLPRSVAFVSDLPKTSTGKIMRRELRKLE